MIKIVTDSSSYYSKAEGLKKDINVTSIHVSINGKNYLEFEDIQQEDFCKIINEGHVPKSSQPSIGEVLEIIDDPKKEETLIICMCDGLSGTYQTAVGAKNSIDDNDHIHVVNTKTLGGPQRYLVDLADKLRRENTPIEEIVKTINTKTENAQNFIIPMDFGFLQRGGRLTPLAAKVANVLKLVPVMYTIENNTKIDKFALARTFEIGINKIIDKFIELNITADHIVYVSHGFNEEKALVVKEKLENRIPGIEVVVQLFTCSFLTQGGPKAISIQTVLK